MIIMGTEVSDGVIRLCAESGRVIHCMLEGCWRRSSRGERRGRRKREEQRMHSFDAEVLQYANKRGKKTAEMEDAWRILNRNRGF